MRIYDQLVCAFCKRIAVQETGSPGRDDGWVRLARLDGTSEMACPDHAATLLVETDGRSNESLEVMSKTLHTIAQTEQDQAREDILAAVTAIGSAIRGRREKGRS